MLARMHIPPLDSDAVPEASKATLAAIAEDLGVVPNMAAAIAASPTLLTAFDALRRAVASAELDATSREVAGLAVGVAVDNRYGTAFHSMVLGRLGVDEAEVERMRAGEPPTETAPRRRPRLRARRRPRPRQGRRRARRCARRVRPRHRADPRARRRVHVRGARRRRRQPRGSRAARRVPRAARLELTTADGRPAARCGRVGHVCRVAPARVCPP
jgi:hypothetical protein